jgi:putative heme-binding domain-containing protein
MIANRWICTGALVLTLAAVPQSLHAGQRSSDIEQGRQLFQGLCVTCHGFAGAGLEAPPLNRRVLEGAPDDQALRGVIAEGIPNRGMPRVRRFTDGELTHLVAYVRSLGQTKDAPIRGNAQKGAETYNRLGCAGCHIVKGVGGGLGPELTAIGRLRGPVYLRQAIVEPAAMLPRGTLPVPARGYSEYLPVVVVTRDGRELQGLRVNEDVFSIQVRDAGNSLHSFRKSEVASIKKQVGVSLMPSFASRLKADELDDLVAYLAGLRGAL